MPIGPALGSTLATTLAGAAASGIAGSLASSLIGGAAGSSNGLSEAAIKQANQLRQQNSDAFQPFASQGTAAANQLGNVLGVNGADASNAAMDNFTGSPGYGYALSQGLRAVDASAAAQGMARSGATLKAEQTLGTNLANQNFNTYIGQLQGLSGLGVQGVQGQANATGTFNNLLTGQTTNMVNTTNGAGTAGATIAGNTINGIYGDLKSSGLFGNGGFGSANTPGGGGGFGNAGTGGTLSGSTINMGGVNSPPSLFNSI